ncbi:alpha/beta hydrolase [Propionibacteriaceae bacterium Y1700]|uniref:alpha/beta hydrolase n=1 Tax=Microlunatus sp. Y1700 TaxID=3418487 RepID=UPI003DA7631A
MGGRFVSETFDHDGGRQVTAYVPARRPELVVFAGDGQLIAPWGELLEEAGAPATLIVGVHRTDDPDEMARITEYSPSFDPERFATHERFFVDQVRQWVRVSLGVALPPERTAVCGVSASAEFALAMGMTHRDVYGVVFAASPGGGYRPPEVLPDRLPRTYLTAGTEEPFFAENATRWADALQAGGADVVLTERAGGHGDPFWRNEFPRMVAWLVSGLEQQ